jgi:hypothetical protein
MAADAPGQRRLAALTALHSGDPITDCLRECIAVAVEYDDAEVISWARRELTGYPKDAAVPGYRQIRVDLIGVRHHDRGKETGPVARDDRRSETRDFVATNRQSLRYSVHDILAEVQRAHEKHTAFAVASLIADEDQLLKPGHDPYTQVFWGIHISVFEKNLDEVRAVAVALLGGLNTSPVGREVADPAGVQSLEADVTSYAGPADVPTGYGSAADGGDLARRSLIWTKWQVYLAAIGIPIAIVSAVFGYLALR